MSEPAVSEVVIDAKVILQIIKHGQDDSRSCDGLDGYICGLLENGVTHVTTSFRNLNSQDIGDDDYHHVVARYQEGMLRSLRKENQDHIIVGLYKKCTNFNIFSKAEDLNQLKAFQKANDTKCQNGTVIIVYDEHRMSNGDFGIRAYRISKKGMKMYDEVKDNDSKAFAVSSVKKANLDYNEILEELPISIKSSNLMNCMLHQVENDRLAALERNVTGTLNSQVCRNKYNDELVPPAYSLACTSNIEEQAELMKESIEEVSKETKRFLDNQRSLYVATGNKNRKMNEIRMKNEALLAAGKPIEEITEEEINKMVRMPEEYNRLHGMVLSYQSNVFCDSVKNISAGNIGKLFVAQGLQDE